MNEYIDVCDHCGSSYDPDQQGHYHHDDCQCEYCQDSDIVKEKKFCCVECETNYINS